MATRHESKDSTVNHWADVARLAKANAADENRRLAQAKTATVDGTQPTKADAIGDARERMLERNAARTKAPTTTTAPAAKEDAAQDNSIEGARARMIARNANRTDRSTYSPTAAPIGHEDATNVEPAPTTTSVTDARTKMLARQANAWKTGGAR